MSTGDEIDDDTKVCPMCAETVKAAARVCRFCGHHFDSDPDTVPERVPDGTGTVPMSSFARATGPPPGRLRLVPVVKKLALGLLIWFLIGLGMQFAGVSAVNVWLIYTFLGMVSWVVYTVRYSAHRRCQHCGHVPSLLSADYPICEDCRNQKWS